MRSITKVVGILLVVSFFLTGCAASSIMDFVSEEELSQIEGSRIFNSNYDDTWAAVIRTAALNGVVIINQDKDSGLVTTDWIVEQVPMGLFQAGQRYRGNFIIEENGPQETIVTITPRFETSIGDDSDWLEVIRPKRHLELENTVFSAIQDNL